MFIVKIDVNYNHNALKMIYLMNAQTLMSFLHKLINIKQ